jgi:hypothetical protein
VPDSGAAPRTEPGRARRRLSLDRGFDFPVTSTIYEIEDQARILWGGTASGITGVHEWVLSRTANGVHVETSESFAGAPVDAAAASLQSQLEASLVAWLGHLKGAAESA